MEYLNMNYSTIEERKIGKTPVFIVTPKGEDIAGTIIFYHGWSSNKTNQIFRANIFASYGYRVILPEAAYHGERSVENFDYEDTYIVKKYMLETIMHNIEEAPLLFKFVEDNYGGKIAVGGHSMGAITAGGLYNFKKDLAMAFIFNGMNDWSALVEEINIDKDIENTSYTELRINDFFLDMDPINQLENFKDRPIVLFNGENDDVINPKYQKNFAEKLRNIYTDSNLLNFEIFENTAHQLTTQMLEKAIMFSKEVASF